MLPYGNVTILVVIDIKVDGCSLERTLFNC
jgi:hypothetical protein